MTSDDPIAARSVLAHTAIVEAGALAARHFADHRALVVESKFNGQDVVSIADRVVEELLRDRISAAFPDDGILGEEDGMVEGGSGYLWVIDPIDGTSCFVHGLADWCVSVALLRDGEIVLGLIRHPADDELFSARRGGGAFLNGRHIRVDYETRISNGLLGLGANFRVPPETVPRLMLGLLRAGGMFIRSGSGALMLAHVACGRLAGYYEPHINAWDCMAGICLIREAGGWVAEFPGPGGLLAGGPIIAAAPQLKDELLGLINQAQAERLS